MSRTPFPKLFPPLTSHQLVIIKPLSPDVIPLYIRLITLCIGAPFTDLIRYSLLAQLSELGLDIVQG